MSDFDDASLVLIPSGYKNQKIYSVKPTDGTGDLTFTRASSATRVQSDGLIEKVRTNLFTYSEQLDNAAWTKNVTTITANAIVAPNGTTTADKVADSSTATAARYIFQSPASSGTIYTSSGYFKKGEYNFVTLHAFGINGAVFNLDTGVKVSQSGGVGSIEFVGNGWYRCSFAFTAGGTSVFFSQSPAGNITYTGTAGSGIYAWGLQLETGDIATDYIATTTAAVSVGPVSGLPRLDYLNSTCPKLLLEPQRTNLVTFSENLDNAAWVKSTTTVTANAQVSPDGYTNAETMTVSTSASIVEQTMSLGAGTYTFSVYVKVISQTTAGQMRLQGLVDAANVSVNFTPTTEWQRFTATYTPTATLTSVRVRGQSFVGTLAVWGAQLEVGAYATSYIPTLGASVTRVADVVQKTGISSLLGGTQGTFFVELDYLPISSGNNSLVAVSGGGNVVSIASSGLSTSMRLNINSVIDTISQDVSIKHKIAISFNSSGVVCFVNGTQRTLTNSSTQIVSGLDRTDVATGTRYNNLDIYQMLYFQTRLTNSQLAELTTL